MSQSADALKALFTELTQLPAQSLRTVIDSVNNDVDPLIQTTGWNGLFVNRLKTGNTFSYWAGGSATATQSLPANTKTYLATASELPYFENYQGDTISMLAKVVDPTGSSIFSADLVLGVDATGIYIQGGATAQQISIGNHFAFNFTLILDCTDPTP